MRSPDSQLELMRTAFKQNLAATLWLAIHHRVAANEQVSIESIIYDCVMESARQCDGHNAAFEHELVAEAVKSLRINPCWQPLEFGQVFDDSAKIVYQGRELGREIADAYKAQVEARANQFAYRWLNFICERDDEAWTQSERPDIELFILGFAQAFFGVGEGKKMFDDSDANLARALVGHATTHALRAMISASGELGQERGMALTQLAHQVVLSTQCAVLVLEQRRMDYFNPERRTRPYLSEDPIDRAFRSNRTTSDEEIARWWLTECYRYEASEITVSPYHALLVSFQTAIGVHDINYCHNDLIPIGLANCLSCSRIISICDQFAGVAHSVEKPKESVRILPDVSQYAFELEHRVRGIQWALNQDVLWGKRM